MERRGSRLLLLRFVVFMGDALWCRLLFFWSGGTLQLAIE